MTPRKASIIDYVPVTIRFPRPLYEKIKQQAEINKRSFNQQIVHLLGQEKEKEEGGER
jgi:hypothetical protein